MDDRLIQRLQGIKLFEEDLFPNASPEDVLTRKITRIRQKHEQETARRRRYAEEEEQTLRDTEQKKLDLASKIEEVRVETQRRNAEWVETRKQIGLVDEEAFELPDSWVVDIRENVYKLNPDFNNLPVEVTGECITFAGRGIQIVLACGVTDTFALPYREVSPDWRGDLEQLERGSVEEFVENSKAFESKDVFRVYFASRVTYSMSGNSKSEYAALFYYPFTHKCTANRVSEDYEEVKKKVTRGPMKREQIKVFSAIRKAAVERDYKTIQDLVAKLGQYYGQ